MKKSVKINLIIGSLCAALLLSLGVGGVFSQAAGKTGHNGWPIISGYTGTGSGPGLAWRDDYNYEKDPAFGGWEYITYYTASNGVQVKVGIILNGNNEIYIPFSDGVGVDAMPNSPYMKAINEVMYGPKGLYLPTDFSAIKNTIPDTTVKRTVIDPQDPAIVAYKEAYDRKRSTMEVGGVYYGRVPGTINDSLFFFTDGVGEYDKKGKALWEIRSKGSYWELTLYVNPAEYQWSGLKEVLGYLSPDGNALKDVIFMDYYVGTELIPEWDTWYPVGSSFIYTPKKSRTGYPEYRFK